MNMNTNNIQTSECFLVETRHGTSLQRRISVLAFLLVLPFLLHAQDPVTLQFTGQNQHGLYVPLSSVNVENLTKRWQEVLYYPDTTLNIGVTGVEEFGQDGDGVRLFQNVPNPFDGVTDFALQLPEASDVLLEIYDLNGKVEATYKGSLDPGTHQFRAWLESPQTYLLNARTENGAVRIKMVNTSRAGQSRIEYIGKGASLRVENPKNDSKGDITMPFNYGDIMSYIGYAHLANTEFTSETVMKAQYNSELLPLTFTLPLPTVTTEAATNIYSTEARLNGSVIENAEYPVTERGFQLADNEQLTGAVNHLADAGGENFHYVVYDLQIYTRYYFRAYARTALGITYGDVLFFDTQALLPEVHTDTVINVKSSRATCSGTVTYNGGAYVFSRGFCYSTSPNPTLGDNHTLNSTGDGSFTSLIVGLMANTTYYVRAYATNIAGTAYGEELTFTTLSPFYCGIDSIIDYDGNIYHTVEIGQQCWMKENLRTTHYEDGTVIPIGTINSETVAYRYAPDGSFLNVPTFGYLYNWAAVMHGTASSNTNPSEVQGICPSGWHVPSYAEWLQLTNYVGSQNQYICEGDNTHIAKALSATHGWWGGLEEPCNVTYYPPSNNATGFTAFPAGYFNSGHQSFRYMAIFGSSTHYTGYGLAYYCFRFQSNYTNFITVSQKQGNSVRCLLDDAGLNDSIAVIPVVTTNSMRHITLTSAICGGMVTASGGAEVSARGVCWSTSPNPTVSDSHTNDGDGTGAFSSNITGLSANTTYWVRAYATNCAGTSYGQVKSFTTPSPITCGTDSITDYDGNYYHTVLIGQQCWMKENLRTTHYTDGTPILEGTVTSDSIPYRYTPQNQSYNVPLYGYHYNWTATVRENIPEGVDPGDVQGVCPTGWHVPNKMEWIQLRNNVINLIQPPVTVTVAMALASTVGWQDTGIGSIGYNLSANNTSGFTAMPAGWTYYDYDGNVFYGVELYYSAIFWSITREGSSSIVLSLENNHPNASLVSRSVREACSVRCLRD